MTVDGDGGERGTLRVFLAYAPGVDAAATMLNAARPQVATGRRTLFVADAAGIAGIGTADGLLTLDVGTTAPTVDTVRAAAATLVLLPDLHGTVVTPQVDRRNSQIALELVAAGFEVWTTLEVRQIQRLAALAQRISGLPPAACVADAIVDAADAVELVDMPPDDLLNRLQAAGSRSLWVASGGQLPDRATLFAMRETALRFVMDHTRRDGNRRPRIQAAGRERHDERLLVCVGPSPTSAAVVRSASRMAQALNAPLLAAHVATSPAGADVAARAHLQLAASLGAEPVVLRDEDCVAALVECARTRGVSRIVVGETRRRGWRAWLRQSLVHRLIAASHGIDVFVVSEVGTPVPQHRSLPDRVPLRRGYLGASLLIAAATGVVAAFDRLGLGTADQVLVYLLAVTATAAWFGRGPSVGAAMSAVLLFNFLFTEPRFTLAVADPDYFFTLGVMLVIGLLVSTLMARLRDRTVVARQREQRAEQLYRLSQELSGSTGTSQIVSAAERRLGALLQHEVTVLLPQREHGPLRAGAGRTLLSAAAMQAAAWALANASVAGAGTGTHPDIGVVLLPLHAPDGVLGVLAVHSDDVTLLADADRRRLLETFAAQVTLALQRDLLTERVHRILAEAENERLRSAVLSSVSHDLRTPLAAITGLASNLLGTTDADDTDHREQLLTIHHEAERLSHLVDNLLHMTRLESGQFSPQREWQLVEDIVGSALTRMSGQLGDRVVVTKIPMDLPMVRVDGVLVELVLLNLLDNACRYAPSSQPLDIGARADAHWLHVGIADRGPGLSTEELHRVFEKFYRGPDRHRDGSRGSGLGLAISAAIATLHGGRLRAENRRGGGARFVLSLPIEAQPPVLDEVAADTLSPLDEP